MLASLSSTSIRWKPIQVTMMNSWSITFEHGKVEVPNQFSAILSCCLVRHHNISLVVILKCARSPKSCCMGQSISWGAPLSRMPVEAQVSEKLQLEPSLSGDSTQLGESTRPQLAFCCPLFMLRFPPTLQSGSRSAPLCRPLKSTRKTLGFTPRFWTTSER